MRLDEGEIDAALVDLEHNRKKEMARLAAHGPRPIASAISRIMARRGYARVLSSESLANSWRAAAGEQFAPHTRVGELKRGRLEVLVANSMIMQELTFVRGQLLQKLQELEPDQKIRDLRFRLGALS